MESQQNYYSNAGGRTLANYKLVTMSKRGENSLKPNSELVQLVVR